MGKLAVTLVNMKAHALPKGKLTVPWVNVTEATKFLQSSYQNISFKHDQRKEFEHICGPPKGLDTVIKKLMVSSYRRSQGLPLCCRWST